MEKEGELTFEQALKRLEEIVETLKQGHLPLDQTVQKFKEGITLFKHCQKKLDKAQLKIEKLVEKEGKVTTNPLESHR